MEQPYQAAVDKRAGNNLRFPNKCAYCLELGPLHQIVVKHKQLKGIGLKVPYCETHTRMIRYMKWIQYGALAFAIVFAFLLGRYFHDHRVFVAGSMGFNYMVAGFIGLGVFLVVLLVLRNVVLSRYFPDQGSLDPMGAVEVVAVYADAFVLLFHNRTFGTEFSQLNDAKPIER